MFFALDKNKQLIDIKDANRNEAYFCLGCGELLSIKAENSSRVHKYFSHLPGTTCTYEQNHDMSEWHYEWQSKFPGCCEVPMPRIKPIHRADVCIHNKVIEFQHSPISEEEFKSRNDFYPKQMLEWSEGVRLYRAKCRLTWLFDMTEHCKSIDNGCIKLKKRNDLFKGYDYKTAGYNLLFEIDNKIYEISNMDDKTGLYHCVRSKPYEKDDFVIVMKMPTQVQVKNTAATRNYFYNASPQRSNPGYKKLLRDHKF